MLAGFVWGLAGLAHHVKETGLMLRVPWFCRERVSWDDYEAKCGPTVAATSGLIARVLCPHLSGLVSFLAYVTAMGKLPWFAKISRDGNVYQWYRHGHGR